MKKGKLILILLEIICATALFANGVQEVTSMSAGSDEIKQGNDNHITVTDVLGREVSVDLPVKSVAYTHYSTSEALKILNAWDLVVARDGYTGDNLIYPNLEEIPALTSVMGNSFEPNMEILLEINPDLLILEIIPMPGIEALINELDGIIPTVAVKTYDPEKMVQSFEILGKLLGKEEEANIYIDWCIQLQSFLSEKISPLKQEELTKIFYKTGYGNVEDLMTFSNELSYVPARNRLTGCINIAADLPSQGGWVPSIDSEWLVEQDYDVLVIGDPQQNNFGFYKDSLDELKEYREQVMSLPVFADSNAVKNNRVYMQDDAYFGTPRFIVGFAYLAKWFHPDLFDNFDPASIQEEYFTKFLKLDSKDIKNGVFVFPN